MHCAHPGCKCHVEAGGRFGQYCSDHCQKHGNKAEGHCGCGHPDCA